MQKELDEEDLFLENIEEDEYTEDDEYDCEENEEYEEEIVRKVDTDEEDLTIQDMADFLKIFGDYSRIKILESIMDIKYTVSDISGFTGLTHSAVSHHLRVLKQAKLVCGVKVGRYVYYQVADKHVKEIYNITRTHIEDFQKTISALEEYHEMAKIFDNEPL